MTTHVHGYVTPEEEAKYVQAVNTCYQMLRDNYDSRLLPQYQDLIAFRKHIDDKVALAKQRTANPVAWDPSMMYTTYEQVEPKPTAALIAERRGDNTYGRTPNYPEGLLLNAAEVWEHNNRRWLERKAAYEASQTAQQTSRMPRYGYGFK